MTMSTNPFDYVTAITSSKKNIMVDDIDERKYNAFIVNRALALFPDTVLFANEMNVNHHIDNRLQFDFLLHAVRKKFRKTQWIKEIKVEDIEAVKEYYGYSNEKAKAVMNLLSKDQIREIKQFIYKGGI